MSSRRHVTPRASAATTNGWSNGFGQRLRLQSLERRGQRQRERERRKRQVARDVEHPRRPARRQRRQRTSCRPAAAIPCASDEDEQERREERRDRQADERHAANGGREESAPAAGHDAERDAEQRRQRQRRHGEHRGVSRGAADESPDRPVVEKRVAEVEARRREPPTPHCATGLRSRSKRARVRATSSGRAKAPRLAVTSPGASRVRSRAPDETATTSRSAKRVVERGTRTINRRCGGAPLRRAGSRSDTQRYPAFHNAGGRCTDGTTPSTRALCA